MGTKYFIIIIGRRPTNKVVVKQKASSSGELYLIREKGRF